MIKPADHFPLDSARQEFSWFDKTARAPRLRQHRQFAESEIVIPEGRYAGRKLRIHRQPYTGLLFDAIDSGQFNRFAMLGPVQSGKTLSSFVEPVLYHLFEYKESVICGVPTMDVVRDKWREEILPIIERTAYRDLLPTKGPGSRGGNFSAIKFKHGPTLKFMSGGGGDEKRSSFTSRVVVVTEADKMDTAGQASDESDPLKQLEARTRAYDDLSRFYLECTVSVEEGRIWQEYQSGTASQIIVPCCHCQAWISPEREDLTGFEQAADEIEAAENSYFHCRNCGEAISDAQRVEMNIAGRLLHRGQTITPAGTIEGEPPRTRTLGFRWSAFNNLFWKTGTIGRQEWLRMRDEDEENAERELCQFWWASPYKSPDVDLTPLRADKIRRRTADNWTKSHVPDEAECLTIGIDLRKRYGHWSAPAWLPEGRSHFADYGVFDIPSDALGVEIAMAAALREFRDQLESDGLGGRQPDAVWIDAGYMTDVVCDYCRESGDRYLPILGRGFAQQRMQWYNRPKKTGSIVKLIGRQYHISWLPKQRTHLVEINADYWKSFLHDRLATGEDLPGAMSLFHSLDKNEHISFSKQLTAEKQVEEFIPNKGTVIVWKTVSRSNHFLDASYIACAAANFCGWRLAPETAAPAAVPATQSTEQPPGMTMPDGRPFLITQRNR